MFICSVKQDLNLCDRNIKLVLSVMASVRYSNKLMLKDWNYRTHSTDVLNLDENKFVHKKNISEGKGSPRYSNPKHARKAQELRIDEVSVQKLRENHETIQKLTSQLQEMQEQMSSMNVRGSYSARVPRSSSAEVHREFVHQIMEDEVDGQKERQDDRREDIQQREESGEVEEDQTHNMSAWR